MNVNVMRIAFRSLLTATNNVHKCASSGRSYSKKGIANKFCLLCFVAVNGSSYSKACETKAIFDLTESGFRFIMNPDLDSLANRMVWIRERGRV